MWCEKAESWGFLEDGQFVVDDQHLTTGADGKTILLKSSMVGFALAEYSNGDDADPVRLPFANECLARCLQRQARAAYAYATTNPASKRRKRAHPSSASACTRPPARTRSRRSDPEIQRSSDAEIQT